MDTATTKGIIGINTPMASMVNLLQNSTTSLARAALSPALANRIPKNSAINKICSILLDANGTTTFLGTIPTINSIIVMAFTFSSLPCCISSAISGIAPTHIPKAVPINRTRASFITETPKSLPPILPISAALDIPVIPEIMEKKISGPASIIKA